MRLLGIPFEKRPSNADETHPRDVDAVQYVQKMARQKGFAVARADGEWILSGDTIVALDGRVVGKPADEAEAFETLRALRGRAHDVYTALCLRTGTDDETVETLCATDVHMRDYSEEDLAAYVASGDYRDKAGGYAIQHQRFHPCTGVTGCYANVMGLPLCHLAVLLKSDASPMWMCPRSVSSIMESLVTSIRRFTVKKSQGNKMKFFNKILFVFLAVVRALSACNGNKTDPAATQTRVCDPSSVSVPCRT